MSKCTPDTPAPKIISLSEVQTDNQPLLYLSSVFVKVVVSVRGVLAGHHGSSEGERHYTRNHRPIRTLYLYL